MRYVSRRFGEELVELRSMLRRHGGAQAFLKFGDSRQAGTDAVRSLRRAVR